MKVPTAKPYFEDIDLILKDIKDILINGRLILGDYTKRFEKEFSKYIDVDYAVAVSCATSALEIVMRYFGIKGKEVIVPSNTFVACPNTIIYAGGKPVFAEINPETYCIDPEDITKKITDKTVGIMVVHLGGLPVPEINKIQEICCKHNLFLLEDASQAHGAMVGNKKVGSLGDAACFSFYATKNMTTGVGGMITTNDKKLVEFAQSLRCHGMGESLNKIENFGYDWLMDEFRAAIGIHQLDKLEKFIRRRNEIAKKYMGFIDTIDGIKYLKVPNGIKHAYYKFIIVLSEEIDKDKLEKLMWDNYNVQLGSLYLLPCHLQPVYAKLGYGAGMLKVTEKALIRQTTLPVFSQMTDEEVEYVTSCLKKALSNPAIYKKK